jgi:hypothetical protein
MKIYIVVQENQNDHGYVDTTVLESYTEERLAIRAIEDLEANARDDGERVDSDTQDGEWTISFKTVTSELYRAPQTSIESQVYIDTGETPVVKEVR